MQKRELERKLSVLYQEQKELCERAQNQISTLGAIISNQKVSGKYAGLKIAALANWLEEKAEDVRHLSFELINQQNDIFDIENQLLELKREQQNGNHDTPVNISTK